MSFTPEEDILNPDLCPGNKYICPEQGFLHPPGLQRLASCPVNVKRVNTLFSRLDLSNIIIFFRLSWAVPKLKMALETLLF
jgi:hypothetical protein